LSRDKLPLGADFCCFFRLLSWQGQRLGSWANLISSIGADEVCCTKHVLRFYRHCHGDCRETLSRPLRPRNISVPSYRPTQQGGCTVSVRQFASGSGEGQHTSPLGDHRHMERSRSGCPINRRGLRGHGLCAPRRFTDAVRPAWQSTLLRLPPGTSSSASGSPTPLTTPGETCPYRRPFDVLTCNRRHAPASGPGASTLCPGRVFSPIGSDTFGRRDCPGERAPPLPRRPT
jgi:hypothetical protein